MAVHLARSSNVREMRTEDLQRQMFQKRNLFSLGNLSLEVNNREELKSKVKTTARKSTHVIKNPPPKVPSQKNNVHVNNSVINQENGLSVIGCSSPMLSTGHSPDVHNRSPNFKDSSSVIDTSSVPSTHVKPVTNHIGKKRGRKRKNTKKQIFKTDIGSCRDSVAVNINKVPCTEQDVNQISNNPLISSNNLLGSNVNKWSLSLKETVQGVKGVLGLMLKMKFVKPSSIVSAESNLSHKMDTNSFTNCVKAHSPERKGELLHEPVDSSINESINPHLTFSSHLQSLHVDCELGHTANSYESQAPDKFPDEKPSSSSELLGDELKDLQPDDDSCSVLTSPSTVDSPSVTIASHITSEEAESEEGALQLWLDDSSGDGTNLNSEKQEQRTSSPRKAVRSSTKKLTETSSDDVPPSLMSVSEEKSSLEPPKSPEMPILKPVTDSPKSDSQSSPIQYLPTNSKVSRRKHPQVVLEPLSVDLLKRLDSGPVNSSTLEVCRLLRPSPKVNKKPESRRNLFTIFTSRMTKHHKVNIEEVEAELPSCSDKLVIDGIEFYSFDTIEALNEYTEHELRKKQKLHEFYTSDDLSHFNDVDFKDITDSAKYTCSCIKPIIPTKTDDITKIKGWRNKLFAAETTQTTPEILPDPEDIKKYHWTKRIELCKHLSHSERKQAGLLTLVKRRRLRLSANKFTKKKNHVKQLRDSTNHEQHTELPTVHSTEEKKILENLNDFNQTNVQVPITTTSFPASLESRTTSSTPQRNSVFESEFLDEFLKSRSKLNMQNESSQVSASIQDVSGELPANHSVESQVIKRQVGRPKKSEVANQSNETDSGPAIPKKRGRPKKADHVYTRRTDGKPFRTPYGLYQFFKTVFLPVGSPLETIPSFSVPLPAKNSIEELPHIVTADDVKFAISALPGEFTSIAIPSTYEQKVALPEDINSGSSAISPKVHTTSKMDRTSYADNRLTDTCDKAGASMERTVLELRNQVSTDFSSNIQPVCKELFCRLGCICDSLKVRKRKRAHCGKPTCMFACVCTSTNFSDEVQTDFLANSGAKPEIMTDDGPVKRRRATRLPAKLMDSAFVWHQGKEFLIDPDLSPNSRIGKKSKSLVKAKLKTSPDKPKMTHRIRYDYSVGTNRPVAPKIPPIRITNIKAKTSYPVITPIPPAASISHSKPAESAMPTPTVSSTNRKVQSATQPMLPFGPSCVNGNMIVDPVINGYLARALICIAHSAGGGSCLKFIGITAVPQTREQRDAVVIQLCNSKENSVAFTHIGEPQVAGEIIDVEKPASVHDLYATMQRSSVSIENNASRLPTPVRVYVDKGSVVCPLGSPQVLFPQVLSSVSIYKNNFMVTGYLVSKCNLKEAAVRANTTGAVVSVPIRVVRGQFVPFYRSSSVSDLEKPVFGAYAIQNLTTHVFVGPFNLSIQKRKSASFKFSYGNKDLSTANPLSSFRGLIPVKNGDNFVASVSTESTCDSNASQNFDLRQHVISATGFPLKVPDKNHVRWNLASEDIECLVSDMLADVCRDEEQDKLNCETNISRVVICGSTIRRASTGSCQSPPKEPSRRSSVDALNLSCVSKKNKSNSFSTVGEIFKNSTSQYDSLCKPVKVVLQKLEEVPLTSVPQLGTTILGDVVETVIPSAVPAEKPRLLHPDVARIAWKKSMQEKSRRLEESRRLASRSKIEKSRRRQQKKQLHRLLVVLDPTNTKALKTATKYPSLISLLSQARLSIRELEGHCRNIEEFKKVLINRRLHLFTQYTRLLKELPDAVQKEAVHKLTIRLQDCCQVRDKRSKVQTTWEPELDKNYEDVSSDNGNAYSEEHISTGSESPNRSSLSDSEGELLDVENVSDVDESSVERTAHYSNYSLHSSQDMSSSTSPLLYHENPHQDHFSRASTPVQNSVKDMQPHHSIPNPTDAAYYSALSSVLCDHADYTTKIVPNTESGSVQHVDVIRLSNRCSKNSNVFDSQDSSIVSNPSDGTMSLVNSCGLVNNMYDGINVTGGSVKNISPGAVQVSDEVLEVTVADEELCALNSDLNTTENLMQFGIYPTSVSGINSQINSSLDSCFSDVTPYSSAETVLQYDNVYISSTQLPTSSETHNITCSEQESATNTMQECFSEVVLPLGEPSPDDACESLPKIIAYSSITEAEFFAEGNS